MRSRRSADRLQNKRHYGQGHHAENGAEENEVGGVFLTFAEHLGKVEDDAGDGRRAENEHRIFDVLFKGQKPYQKHTDEREYHLLYKHDDVLRRGAEKRLGLYGRKAHTHDKHAHRR